MLIKLGIGCRRIASIGVVVGSFILEDAGRGFHGRHRVHSTDHERVGRSGSDHHQKYSVPLTSVTVGLY